ncbi:MAG: ComEC/Rec2 family competence protein [Acidimicrobiales bacterium]
MSDRWVVALAFCAAAGAVRPSGAPLVLGLAGVCAALLLRRPLPLCLAIMVLVSSLAARSLAGLDGVEDDEPVAAEVVLVTDPRPSFGGLRADARLGGRRVELRADGVAAEALHPRLAGEVVAIRGDLGPVPDRDPWLAARHVSGRVRVVLVEGWRPGPLPARVANAVRRTLADGAASLDRVERSLFTGLVIGDDRDQPAAVADDFLGAGLTHLLAVSGQNVAFVLALAGGLLRRLRLWPRLITTLLLVGLFGLMTRFEPSVLRAATMAALATATGTIGIPLPRLRLLALAVTGLLVVDPLLARSVGFQLSTAASAAIVLWAPRLVDVLPGPSFVREPLAVTVAAQLGVAPVLIATFGPLPVASFPANLLAVPAAAAVMAWGFTGGMVAGLVGGPAATVLHAPTRLLVGWLSEVAARCAALPLGALRAGHVVALGLGLAGAAVGRARGRESIRPWGLGVAATALALAAVSAHAPPPLRTDLTTGVVRWHAGSTDVLVLGGAGRRSSLGSATVLAALRESGVRSVDLLVVADGQVAPAVVTAVADRHPIGSIVAADAAELLMVGHPVARGPTRAAVLEVGALEVRLTPTADRLVVDATPRRTGSVMDQEG